MRRKPFQSTRPTGFRANYVGQRFRYRQTLRKGTPETRHASYLHHVSIAIGSTAEAETQVLLSGRLQYMPPLVLNDILHRLDRLGRMLGGLQRSLKAKL